MPKVILTPELKEEYKFLFDSCVIRVEKIGAVGRIIAILEANKERYIDVATPFGIPWFFVAVIHNMEASCNFNRHFHNGDPLSARTVHVPEGRPKIGEPPFLWEDSATDALKYRNIDAWKDWSIPGTLYQIEGYNGWGYRLYHSHVYSPYLWGYSNHYISGKYVEDGKWSDTAVSKQCGAATILRRMFDLGIINFKEVI